MTRQIIQTDKAPAPVGAYSQAVRVGSFLYTAGQVAIDPETGKLITDDITLQAEQALRNLRAILEAAGGSMQNVVKTTVFLKDMGEFQAMNTVYGSFFPSEPPARSAVQVAALPLGARVEIEAVAYLPDAAN
jgi:2-iminobutanoate/2-iminopropanoate deaminase